MRVITRASLLLFGLLLGNPCFSQSYDYVNPLNRRHTISIQVNPAFVAMGDRALDAKFCAPSSGFYCVSSGLFEFAVPSSGSSTPPRWTHGDLEYVVSETGQLVLLGRRLQVMFIESAQGPRKVNYAYSRKDGLVAISIITPDAVATFISIKPNGFGATGAK